MYDFSDYNALYSASLSNKIFVFILTAFSTWDCSYLILRILSVILFIILILLFNFIIFGTIIRGGLSIEEGVLSFCTA